MSDDFLAPPAFKPQEALLALKRQLRELRPLAERGNAFEFSGKKVIELVAGEAILDARLAKRAAVSPDWVAYPLKSSADVRRFVDIARRQISGWRED